MLNFQYGLMCCLCNYICIVSVRTLMASEALYYKT